MAAYADCGACPPGRRASSVWRSISPVRPILRHMALAVNVPSVSLMQKDTKPLRAGQSVISSPSATVPMG